MASTRIELIAPRVFAVGERSFGPRAIPDNIIAFRVEVYRCTSADPAMWPDPASFLQLGLEVSTDGGATWNRVGGFGAHGGVHVRRDGVEADASIGQIDLPEAPGRQIRGTVTVTGAPVRTGIAIEIDTVPLARSQRRGR